MKAERRGGDAGPRPVASSLDQAARSLGAPRAGVVETVFRRWDEIVGPALASHCRPLSVSDDTLVVAVDDPAHGSELRYLAEDLLAAIEDLTGTRLASRLVVRVRPPGPRRHDARW